MQDKDGGHAVYTGGALFDAQVGFAHEAIGLDGGEALIPHVDGELEPGAEFFGEGRNFLGLSGVGAGEAEGESDDDFEDVVAADYFRQLLEVGALVAALECVDALGGDAERVGDGHANAAIADIESEEAARLPGI